jgi:hypothetical protein
MDPTTRLGWRVVALVADWTGRDLGEFCGDCMDALAEFLP